MRREGTAGRGVWWRRGAGGYALVAAAYVAATLTTGAHFMGDTVDYVDSVAARAAGEYYRFWEFAHLLYRPLGLASYYLLRPVTRLFVGDGTRANVAASLIALNWAAGLACALLARRLVRQFSERAWAANVLALGFVFAQAFLNYAQTGCSYVPGLALLLAGLCVLTRDVGCGAADAHAGAASAGTVGAAAADVAPPETLTPRSALLGGTLLAGAALLWIPYLLVLPGALAAPLFLAGFSRRGLRPVLLAAAACGAIGTFAYALVLARLRIYDLDSLRAWMRQSTHGVELGGLFRAVFGLARSFINTGNDGVMLKRFLLGDPLNPVSLADLLRLSLWKPALFYLFLAAVLSALLAARRGRRHLALLAAASAPLLLLAVLLEGGAIERYMPLYPFVFMAAAVASAGHGRAAAAVRWIAPAFVAALALTNYSAMAGSTLRQREEASARRLVELRPALTPQSLVVTINLQDELMSFSRDYLFNPANVGKDLRVHAAVNVNTAQAARWREDFAARAAEVWEAGGRVWLSRRALAARPRPEWSWVEGDDRRVLWGDLPAFFSQFEVGAAVGGEDGFVELPPSERNRRIVGELLPREGGAPGGDV